MIDELVPSLERRAFAGLWALLLGPILAQGLWRPLTHFLGHSGQAAAVTGGALAVSAAVAIAHGLWPLRATRRALAAGGLFAVAATVGLSLALPGLLTLLAVAAAVALLLRWLPARLPVALDGLARRHAILTAIYGLAALSTVVSVARVSIFVGDPTRVDQQALPGEAFLATHSCLTAYVHASALSRQRVDNLYAEQWWPGADGHAPLPPGAANPYGAFRLDYYAYPPPFLLLTAPLAPFAGDFPAQRALWFGLNGLLFALGLWITARWLDGPGGHRTLLLAPIFLGSLPVLATLQVGNFQIAVVVISILAMVAFHRDRPAIGGALLALAILSKISPGVLGLVLLVQRRWRDAAWTAGFGLLLLGLSTLTVGINPLRSFLTYTLPRLSSGEAFAFMDDSSFSILTNGAPFGIPFRLRLAGLDVGDPWRLARPIARAYTVVLVVLAVVAARRPGDRRAQGLTWMALLVLAALQSPFAPAYTAIALLWASTLLAVEVRGARGAVLLALLWLDLTISPRWLSLPLHAACSLFQSAVAIAACIWLVVRGSPAAGLPRGQ